MKPHRIVLVGIVLILAPGSVTAQTYNYTARTAAPALETGAVPAGSLTWQCADRECRISGPWAQPGVAACAQLAAKVGRIVSYGYPGRTLNAEQLRQCNANAASQPARQATIAVSREALTRQPPVTIPPAASQTRVEPQPRSAVVREAAVTLPRITSRTVEIQPPPSDRLYAVQTGRGDGDFAGNGPEVELRLDLTIDGACLYADVKMHARETRPDWTSGRLDRRLRVWCEPDGAPIERIVTPVSATGNYVDNDWEIDVIVPGHGKVDPRRIPEVSGPVRAFMVMGDTNGPDVGPVRSGRKTVRGTSVQIQYNPIRVVVPIVESPAHSGPPGSHSIVLSALHSNFFVLPHTAGDREFGGNGPRMTVHSMLSLSPDRRRLLATFGGTAVETRGGDTRAEGTRSGETLWTAPEGWRIDSVDVEYGWWENDQHQRVRESALDRTATATYTDRDHEHDFLVEGVGEAPRQEKVSVRFADPVHVARRNARSHVRVFHTVGDTDGPEAGSRTGVRVFYEPLHVRLAPIDPARADLSVFQPNVLIDVPTGDYTNRLSGDNSCGPSSGSRVLRFYGVNTTYEQFKRRVHGSGNLFTENWWGTPPGTLRDRMNEMASGFVHQALPLGDARKNRDALERLRTLLDQGKPVIVLVGWGSQLAADIWSPHDSINALHWVVVRGYNSRNRSFYVIDNGFPEEWSALYLESMMDYGIDGHFEIGLGIANVEKGSIIYRR